LQGVERGEVAGIGLPNDVEISVAIQSAIQRLLPIEDTTTAKISGISKRVTSSTQSENNNIELPFQ
jgi:hypothetical protein